MNGFVQGGAARVITILGGGGFVGRTLVTKLLAAGHTVRVGSRNPLLIEALTHIPGPGRVELVKAGVLDRAGLAQAFDGAGAAVNCVSVMNPDVATMRRINVEGAELAARTAHEAGVSRYIHVSAIGASLTSPGAYGRSKGEAEYAVRSAFPKAGLIRPSVVFGPQDRFLNMFALIAKLSPVLPVFAPQTRFQPVYVGDLADAMIGMLADGTQGRIVEAGGPDVLTMRALMAFVLEATGRRRFLLPIPLGLARVEAALLEKLPGHILTRDQVAMMGVDNVVQPGMTTLTDLGIAPHALRRIAPAYLSGGIWRSWKSFSGS